MFLGSVTIQQLVHCSTGGQENVGPVEDSRLKHCSVTRLSLFDVVTR